MLTIIYKLCSDTLPMGTSPSNAKINRGRTVREGEMFGSKVSLSEMSRDEVSLFSIHCPTHLCTLGGALNCCRTAVI